MLIGKLPPDGFYLAYDFVFRYVKFNVAAFGRGRCQFALVGINRGESERLRNRKTVVLVKRVALSLFETDACLFDIPGRPFQRFLPLYF